MRFSLWPLFLALFAWAYAVPAGAAEWPANYVVQKGSTSPDGRYAILVPGENGAGEDPVRNFVVDLPGNRVVGSLEKADYEVGRGHYGLAVA